jgi:hypothetical protein
MSKELLVGLCGPAGCGKDTVASLMVQRGFHRYALAQPIKGMVSLMLSQRLERWEDREWKEAPIPWLGRSPRQLAQTLGTEWGREHVDPDLWLKLGMQRWELVKYSAMPRLVITDIRFVNEAQAIIGAGGTIWKVLREDVAPVSAHVSEQGIPPALITGTIKNYGSLDELPVNVAGWLTFLMNRYAR